MQECSGGSNVAAMSTFWTVITISAVVLILAVGLWTFVVAPFWVPRHSVKP